MAYIKKQLGDGTLGADFDPSLPFLPAAFKKTPSFMDKLKGLLSGLTKSKTASSSGMAEPTKTAASVSSGMSTTTKVVLVGGGLLILRHLMKKRR